MTVPQYKIFLCYIKSHKSMLITDIVCIWITIIVLYLYNIPLNASGYAACLCLLFLFIWFIVSFYKYYQKHNALLMIKDRAGLELDPFWNTDDLIEKDYQEIIVKLHECQMQLIAGYDSSQTDMIDYYTMWAHQIKTPIAAMNLLLKSHDSGENTALLAELFKIEQYVDMVLSYLRLDSSSTDYVIAPCSLVNIVRGCIHKYARIFIMKKIRLAFQEEDFFILTDEKWFSFVIEQLLSNALKYTKEGTVTITIDRIQPALIISDTGIGIRQEDLPRIFEKGFTGYNGRSGQKSTGLGLYLCKRILTKLSHTIEISSRTGIGTTVRIGLDTYKS